MAVGLSLGAVNLVYGTPITWAVNGHQYEVILEQAVSWDVARAGALSLGTAWDLASITSQAEQDFIKTLLPVNQFHRDHLWLGGLDVNTEGVWEWSNGDAFTYTNWWEGEPNNNGNEDYLAMDWRGYGDDWKWNDIPVNTPGNITGYIVEKPSTVPEPTTMLLLALGLVALGFTRFIPGRT